MKRILRVAGLALLGLSIAGYATYVLAQQPAPVSLPGTPSLPTPVAPTLPNPVVPVAPTLPTRTDVPVPGGATLPPVSPVKPGAVVPIPGGDPVTPLKPGATLPDAKPGAITLPGGAGPMDVHPAQPAANDDAPGVTEPNPTGRQEPAVSLEWIGPPAAKLGQAADYTIVVRNVCNIAVQQVLVRVRLAEGITVAATEPKAVSEENVLMWEVGTMLPKQERNLLVKMASSVKGDINCQAWVTFTGSSSMRIRVREPKLLIKAIAQEKVLVGDGCTFTLTVSNPGDHPADQVKIHAELSEGLESTRGNKFDVDIGSLAAGETRSIQVLCATKIGGSQQCEAFAEAEGGLKATDKAATNVIMPQITLEEIVKKFCYLDRKTKCVFKVTNPGDAPASNVVISDLIPPGFKFLSGDNGCRHDFSTRTASWFLGELGPGQTREVVMELLAVNKGEHHHRIVATASRGLKVEHTAMTRVEGLSALGLELVDLEDPVEVGGETVYEIRITNTGTQTETDVKLVCTIPEKMEFKAASGPGAKFAQQGNLIIFEPLPKLAPRADAIFRVSCKAISPGVATFKARINSTLLVDGVLKEEPTRIYQD